MKPEDIEDLKQLIEFLKENQVAEFDLDRGDMKIRLKFAQAVAPAVVHTLANLPIMAAPACLPPQLRMWRPPLRSNPSRRPTCTS